MEKSVELIIWKQLILGMCSDKASIHAKLGIANSFLFLLKSRSLCVLTQLLALQYQRIKY